MCAGPERKQKSITPSNATMSVTYPLLLLEKELFQLFIAIQMMKPFNHAARGFNE
jgi:hypothetical protein